VSPRTFKTIESHTAGNPTRSVLTGFPALRSPTMLERMRELESEHDWVRTALMLEPRGSSIMSGCLVMPPCDPRADFGILYIESSGYLPMCGHDTIGVVTALLECGLLRMVEPTTAVVLDTPAGLVETTAQVSEGRVRSVTFASTPSFLQLRDVQVHLPSVGYIRLDVAWGGNYYAIVQASDVRLDLTEPGLGARLRLGDEIRNAVNAIADIRHPVLDGVQGVTHVEFIGPPTRPDATNLCSVVIRPGGADRSPCGTGTAARSATLVERGLLDLGSPLVHESITGEIFTSVPFEEVPVGPFNGIRSHVTGTAYVTGTAEWSIDPVDPLRDGFLFAL